MGHRSWLTYCQSINEWFDLWEKIGNLADASDELKAMGVDKAHVFIQEHLNGQIPSMFDLSYVLKISNSEGPFPQNSVVLAWSSTGDSTIQALPYYLRQQTEYLGALLAKFPEFNSEEGVSNYGELYTEIRSPKRYTIVEDRLRDAPTEFFPFLTGLPDYFETSYGQRTEANFLNYTYLRVFDDPSQLASANRTVFMSHNTEDKPFVRKLAESLREFGIGSWVDEAEIKIGDSLIWKISDAIEECDFLIAILSKSSINSKWVKKELEMAMTEELSGDRYKVIPLIIDDTKIPLFLKGKLYADFSDDAHWSSSILKLVESIHPGSTLPKLIEEAGYELERNATIKPDDSV